MTIAINRSTSIPLTELPVLPLFPVAVAGMLVVLLAVMPAVETGRLPVEEGAVLGAAVLGAVLDVELETELDGGGEVVLLLDLALLVLLLLMILLLMILLLLIGLLVLLLLAGLLVLLLLLGGAVLLLETAGAGGLVIVIIPPICG